MDDVRTCSLNNAGSYLNMNFLIIRVSTLLLASFFFYGGGSQASVDHSSTPSVTVSSMLSDHHSMFYENKAKQSLHANYLQALALWQPELNLVKNKLSMDELLQNPTGKKNEAHAEVIDSDEPARMLTAVPNGSPFYVYRRVSSLFGERFHPFQKKLKFHKGLDFSVAAGTPVQSTAHGIVIRTVHSRRGGYGKYVVVRHASGFTTLYAHLQSLDVHLGDVVHKGSLLGKSGNTGHSTGPHLHYEVRFFDMPLDPAGFMERSPDNYSLVSAKK
jgi:murein DD-endopeptidase MepM/ murein hydrolase activator NlpD